MALSYTTYSADADNFAIGFNYLATSHVKVLVATVDGGSRTILGTSDYSIDESTKLLTITPAIYPTSAAPLKIYRETPGITEATKDAPFVDFVNGTVLNEADLDNASLQALYLAQESRDHVDDSLATVVGNENLPSITESGQIVVSNASLIAEWEDVDAVISADVAATANTIPRRNSSSKVVGDVTGDLEGVADEAVILKTSRNFSISGDVSTSSGVGFDGSGATNLPTTVGKIQGVVVSSTTPTEGQVFAYRTATWVPENLAKQVAVYSGQGGGPSIAAEKAQRIEWDSEDINTISSSITATLGSDYFALAVGTYLIQWSVPFYSATATSPLFYTVLIGSLSNSLSDAEATHDDLKDDSDVTFQPGVLDSTIGVKGRGTIARIGSADEISTSQGIGKVTVSSSTTLYIQVLGYSTGAGNLGGLFVSAAPWNICNSIINIEKTS